MASLRTIKPNNPLISSLVDYYYFQESVDPQFENSFIYYPHYGNALNVYLDANLSWNEDGRSIKGNQKGNVRTLLTMNRKRSRTVHMSGCFKKMGVIFRPLGINSFLPKTLKDLQIDIVGDFPFFGETFEQLAAELFEVDDLPYRASQLDQFLQSKLQPFSEHRVQRAVQLIFDSNADISAQDLATELDVNRRTLLRLFQKHLACSVNTFKTIVQFRLALHQYFQTQQKPKLSELAYDNAYYDQAHFIHHFQAVTGLSPKALFKLVKVKSETGTYWSDLSKEA